MSEALKRFQTRDKHFLIFKPGGLSVDDKVTFEKEAPRFYQGITEDGEQVRVWKHGSIWKGSKGEYILAVEGSVLTAWVDEHGDQRTSSVKELLEEIWPKGTLDKLPGPLRSALEAKWHSQVTVVPSEIEDGAKVAMDAFTANELLFESNVEQAQAFGKATEEPNTIKEVIIYAVVFLLGYMVHVWVQVAGIWGQ